MVRKIRASKEEREAAKHDAVVEQPDEFLQTSRTVYDWMAEHSKLVITVIAVLFVAGVAYSSASAYSEHVDGQASSLLGKMLEVQRAQVDTTGALKDQGLDIKLFASEEEKAQALRDEAQKVLAAHPGHQAAAIAGLFLGKACLQLNDNDTAVSALEKSVATFSAGGDPLVNSALLGLGAAYEAKDDSAKATEAFLRVADGQTAFEKDQGLYQAGRLLIAAGEKDRAKSYLERIETDFPESSLKADSSTLLQGLK